MFVSSLIVFMEEQVFGGPYSAILEVFPQSTLLTPIQVVPDWGVPHPF